MTALHAFFYLRDAEPMPENAPDEWFLGREDATDLIAHVDTFATHAYALLDDLADLEGEDAFQYAFYERAKAAFGTDGKQIREFFRMLYLIVFGREDGPRWGQFVVLYGREAFLTRLRTRLDTPVLF